MSKDYVHGDDEQFYISILFDTTSASHIVATFVFFCSRFYWPHIDSPNARVRFPMAVSNFLWRLNEPSSSVLIYRVKIQSTRGG